MSQLLSDLSPLHDATSLVSLRARHSMQLTSRDYRLFDVEYAGEAVAYMANLPLGVNILSQVRVDTPTGHPSSRGSDSS